MKKARSLSSISGYPIFDLHCDLLSYLSADPKRTALDPASRCSLPQLTKGGVAFQTMAIFAETQPRSAIEGSQQASEFLKIKKMFLTEGVETAIAVENASSFCNEDELFEHGLSRLSNWMNACGLPFYISLTWNTENRFGGGAHTARGLKPDGYSLLEFLSNKNIAIDISHASDALAYDIFNCIDAKNLTLRVIASHSNFRSVHAAPRNLPDELAKEIIARKGLIGVNIVKLFVGSDYEKDLCRHVEYGMQLGGEDSLSLGADFFSSTEITPQHRKPDLDYFVPGFDNASCYPKLISLIQNNLNLDDRQLNKITSGNASSFFRVAPPTTVSTASSILLSS